MSGMQRLRGLSPMIAAVALVGAALAFGGRAEDASAQATVTYVTRTFNIPSPGAVHSGPRCPGGTKVVGGGYNITTNDQIPIRGSYPFEPYNAWFVQTGNNASGSTVTVVVYATCIP